MNIAFWDNQLCERGTTTSLFDYAFFNKTILGNNSFIFFDKNRDSQPNIIDKFKKHFVVHETNDFIEVDTYLLKYNITHIYIIKGGSIDSRISRVAKNCIHCVFNCYQPHGEVYSSISPCVKGNDNKYPVVPHMINLPNNDRNLRAQLKIPENAIVFGGYGGKDSFDIKFVQNIVYQVAQNNLNIYFLFANFNTFCPKLPNIIHLPTITDLDEKVAFINTCDANLWARSIGETFGLTIGEFSTKNKPIVTMKIGDLSHATILGDNAFWYHDENSLLSILLNFNPNDARQKKWNAYADYAPDKVIQIFKKTFLD
jgi:hypothetical protein